MECPAGLKCFVLPLVLGFTTYVWLGCSKSDLSGYHRISGPQSVPGQKAHATDRDAASTVSQAADNQTATDVRDDDDTANSASEVPLSALLPVNLVDGANIRSVIGLKTVTAKPEATAETAQSTPPDTPRELRKIELLVKEKSFRTEPKTGALRVSFDDLDLLKVLNMDPVVPNADELMPDWLSGLAGKLVRIRGFMYPTYDTEGIERFVLARDNQICCFGRDPKIYDLIQVDMKPGKSTNYIPATRAFDVVGKFRIQMQSEDGKPFGLYVIEQADVIDR